MSNDPPKPEPKLPPRVTLYWWPGGVYEYELQRYSSQCIDVPMMSTQEHESLLLAERERCRREVQEARAEGRIAGLQEAIREIQRGNLPYNRECKLTRKLFFLQKTREPIPAPGSEGAGGDA